MTSMWYSQKTACKIAEVSQNITKDSADKPTVLNCETVLKLFLRSQNIQTFYCD